MMPRRLITPLTNSGASAIVVTTSYPLISCTSRISIPYSSLPSVKVSNSRLCPVFNCSCLVCSSLSIFFSYTAIFLLHFIPLHFKFTGLPPTRCPVQSLLPDWTAIHSAPLYPAICRGNDPPRFHAFFPVQRMNLVGHDDHPDRQWLHPDTAQHFEVFPG